MLLNLITDISPGYISGWKDEKIYILTLRLREICNGHNDKAPSRNIISVRGERACGVSRNRWSVREDFVQWRRGMGSLDPFTLSDFCLGGDTFEECSVRKRKREGGREKDLGNK